MTLDIQKSQSGNMILHFILSVHMFNYCVFIHTTSSYLLSSSGYGTAGSKAAKYG